MPQFEHFTITKTTTPNIKAGLFLSLRFMHGDADKYETVEISVSDEAELLTALDLLARLSPRPEWFSDEAEWLSDWWPWDVTTSYNFRAALVGTSYFFREADGTQYFLARA